ncbi:MAG: excinuclease ABC subunit UvrA, partial [Lacrimispora sphenoides]
MADIKQLIDIMNRLVEQNSTLIVIEHNLDIICQADWIIDLGPHAGQHGGKIMFTGLPEDLINCKDSLTGKSLKKYMNRI